MRWNDFSGKPSLLRLSIIRISARFTKSTSMKASTSLPWSCWRFLMAKSEEDDPHAITQMILVQNWFMELKRRIPAGK